LLELGKEENIYAKFGLGRNPFPPSQLPQVFDPSYVKNVCIAVRERELSEIKEKFLEIAFGPADQPGRSTNLWIHGELGVGKTAIIYFIYDLLKEFKSDIVVSLYIVSPGNGIEDIYKATIDQLGKSFFEKLGRKLVIKVIKDQKELIHGEDPSQILEHLEAGASLSDLVQKKVLEQEELFRKAASQLSEGRMYVSDKMVHMILEMTINPEEVWESIKNFQKRDRLDGIVTMFYLFNRAGYKMTIMFIDQMESSWKIWGKQKKNRFTMDVRELVQRSIPYLSVLTTSNNELSEDVEINYPTFLRPLPRDPGKIVVVKKLKKELIRTLVEFYLVLGRISKKGPELFPFTETAVDVIYDEQAGVTGNILTSCFGILDYAARRNYDIIDEKVAKEYLFQKEKEEEETSEVSEIKSDDEGILR
jgi:hypothetical protein